MKQRTFCFSILIVFLVLIPFGTANAQKVSRTSQFEPYWQINVNGGTSLFFGDLKQKSFWPATYSGHSEWRMGTGLMLTRQFSSFFGLRLQALYGQVSGISTSTNRFFQGNYLDFNLNGTFNLNTLIAGYNPERKLNVYLIAGVGLTNYNSDLYNLATASIIERRGYGYGHGLDKRTLEGIATGGVGLSYMINDKWSINFESVDHILNSDKMDMVVKNSKYDMYNYTSLGVSFKFGQRKHRIPTKEEVPLPKPFTPNPAVVTPATKENAAKTNETMPVQPPKADSTLETIKKVQVKQEQQKIKEPVRHILPVQPILEYRVQIRARYKKPVSLSYLSKHYHIPETSIRTDMNNGYYIYTVGSYDTYTQARTERDILRTQNGVTDAFVVLFKNGRRLEKLPK
ncbi:MAG: porin family protein [Bacteroidales bacterium]|nr:porin family protein [Bacteroidales bacterium]